MFVSANRYRDADLFPVNISLQCDTLSYLMLVPRKARFEFLPWDDFKARHAKFAAVLAHAEI
jgi:hypothetical protein